MKKLTVNLEKDFTEKKMIRISKEKEKEEVSKKIEEKNELKQELGKSKIRTRS